MTAAAHTAVGLGAIVGAPLMLSTVALFVMGTAALAFRKRRGRIALRVVREDARRDLAFFFPVFLCLVIAGTLEMGPVLRHLLAVALLIVYASYSVVMLRLKRAAGAELEHGLYLESIFRGNPLEPRGWVIAAQVTVGVLAILLGAVEFVDQIILFSAHAHLNPGVLSLILSPLATELPENTTRSSGFGRARIISRSRTSRARWFSSRASRSRLALAFSPWHLTNPELLADRSRSPRW